MLFTLQQNFFFVFVCLIGTTLCFPAETRPEAGQVDMVSDALKHLQELNTYYSQVARPRFGKRSRIEEAILSHPELLEASEKVLLEALSHR